MNNGSHLSALQVRLSNERNYLARAKADGERQLRKVWISQIEREIEQETKFIGTPDSELTDDELLAELTR